MPASDIVEVTVVLDPQSQARASLGIGLIIHALTDDQDDQFGDNRAVQLFPATWPDTMALLGISDGEPAYEDVQAHFSQRRQPSEAYIGRRGDLTQNQVKTVTIADDGGGNAIDGTYRLLDIEGGPYTYVASSVTVTVARDAILALITAGTHPSFTDASSGADAIEMTAAAVGVNIPMTLEAPTGGAVLATTTSMKELKRAQVVDTTFGSGTDGLYTWVVQTTTGQKTYQHSEISGVATGTTIAAAFKVLYDADPSDLYGATATAVGPTVSITAAVAGTPGSVTIDAPNADATVSFSVTNYNIADDIDLLDEERPEAYVYINGSHLAIDIEQAAEKIETMRKLHVVQSSDADIQTTADDDVFSRMQDDQRGRTAGVEHPIDAEGVHAAWSGVVTTRGVGSVNWNAQPLTGLSGQTFAQQVFAANIRGKEGSYLEKFRRRDQDVLLGGYAFDGRPFDLRRAIDTFCGNVEAGLLDLLINEEIVPYSDEGIALAEAVILNEFEVARDAGYGVSLDLTVPEIVDATSNEQTRGIMPAFSGHVVMQVGTYKIIANFTVSQEQLPEAA